MRRFRVFERAIATLECNIDRVRQDNSKSLAELEKRLTMETLDNATSERTWTASLKSATEAGQGLQVLHERDTAIESTADSILGKSRRPSLINKFPTIDTGPRSELPPIVYGCEVGEVDVVARSTHNKIIEDREPIFTTVTADEAIQKDGWKDIVVFGLTAFSAALLLAILVMAFTNRAGASYIPGSETRKLGEQPRKQIGVQKERFPIAILDSGHPISINSVPSAAPPSTPAILAAKGLELEKLAIRHITLNQVGSIEPEEKVKLAQAYLRGDGVRADPMMAAFWSEVAAQQGSAEAQYILGALYSEGIKPNAEEAFRWFSSAAVLGNPKAMHNLAIALLNGAGVAKDKTSAVNWFVRAANLGYRDSAFDLGVLYERGEGVAQNSRTALFWYDNAASLGDAQAGRRAALLRSDGLEISNRN